MPISCLALISTTGRSGERRLASFQAKCRARMYGKRQARARARTVNLRPPEFSTGPRARSDRQIRKNLQGVPVPDDMPTRAYYIWVVCEGAAAGLGEAENDVFVVFVC